MRASALQRALPVVAGMIADRTGVEVKTGTCAETDGKVIFLPPLPMKIEEDDFVRAIGYIYHECGHVTETDFSVIGEITSALQMAIWNQLEDVRIERAQMGKSPGARSYLTKLVEILVRRGLEGKAESFGLVPDDEATPASSVFQAYLLYKLRHDVLEQTAIKPLLESAEVAMERFPQGMRTKLEALIFEVKRCESSGDVLALANEIILMIQDEDEDQNKDDEQGDGDEGQGAVDQTTEGDGGMDAASQNAGTDGDPAPEQEGDNESQDPHGDSDSDTGDGQGQDEGGSQGASGHAGNGSALKELLSMTEGDLAETIDQKLQKSLDMAAGRAAASGRVVTSANVHQLRLPNKQADTSRIKGAINLIRVRTLSFLSSIAECDTQLVHSGRSLDFSKLFHGRFGGPMFSQAEEGIDINTDLLFLGDASGSMDGQMGLAGEAVLASILAYDVSGINTQVAVFPVAGQVNGSTDPDGVGIVKRWSESPRIMGGRIQSLVADGSTPMAEAILWATCEMLKRDPARRIIVVSTDGDPDDVSATLEAIEFARSNGIYVLGLGIGRDVTKVFGSAFSAKIDTIVDLAGSMVKLIQRAMRGI